MEHVLIAFVALAIVVTGILAQRHRQKQVSNLDPTTQRLIDVIREKQRSGMISTGLMISLGDANGGLSTEAMIQQAFSRVNQKYERNPRAKSAEYTRLYQSILQQTLIVPNVQDLSKSSPLTVSELVRHLIGTWQIDPRLFVGRYVMEVDVAGNVIPERRVEITAEMISNAARQNQKKEPLSGELMDRKVHAARLHQQLLMSRQNNSPEKQPTQHGMQAVTAPDEEGWSVDHTNSTMH
jgi:hypothetical protein